MDLNSKLTEIYGVGPAQAKRLAALELATVGDLLRHFPFRYDDLSKLTPIKDLRPDTVANVVGRVELIQGRRAHRRRMFLTEALVADDTGELKVIWFNQPFVAKALKAGDRVSLAGKAEPAFADAATGKGGPFVMKSPVYEKLGARGAIHTQGIVPNYRLTANLTQKQLRYLMKQAVALAPKAADRLPPETLKRQGLLPLAQALAKVHFPLNFRDVQAAQERLAFDELFLLQLQSLLVKREMDALSAFALAFKEAEVKRFVASLPFKLTDHQRAAAWEIIQDTGRPKPMARLLEGDVGSGKTLVAVIALLNTALNGKQGALMVPTEILAQQHYTGISKLMEKFDIKIALSTGSKKEMSYKLSVIGYEPLTADIIIGTHALIYDKTEFKDLALAVIDEQHRFGVEQRKALLEKVTKKTLDTRHSTLDTKFPHLLSMTATPIPRSLALALYGDLELSIIKEVPKGRQPIATFVVPEHKRAGGYDFIRKEIRAGRQAFVICPLIDESDKLGVKSAKAEYEKLAKEVYPDLRIGLLHGKMKAKDKEGTMRDFLEAKVQILVSTSVVEVGVDVPNATIMVIEGADRFGLAQLHQFRGRVGRGAHKSYCFLFTESDAEKTMKRLDALAKNNSGFDLAKIDLELRGPGEVYGTSQSGFPELKVATLFDYELMKKARAEAEIILNNDEKLAKYPLIKETLGKIGSKHLE